MRDKYIGRQIQRAREEAGLSQGELAARIGCTQSALSNYELGKRKLSLINLVQIARALNKPLRYFTGPTGETEQEEQGIHLLEDRRLRDILLEAAELPAAEQEAILRYIRQRKAALYIDESSIWLAWGGIQLDNSSHPPQKMRR